jgi:hypothetical protein
MITGCDHCTSAVSPVKLQFKPATDSVIIFCCGCALPAAGSRETAPWYSLAGRLLIGIEVLYVFCIVTTACDSENRGRTGTL